MKKTLYLTIIALGLITVFGFTFAIAGPPVNKATGGGTVDRLGCPLGYSTVAFNAQVDANGVAKGEAQLTSHDTGYKVHGDVTCLRVVNNQAWIGVVLTQSNVDFAPVGSQWVFTVVDNGQGSKALDLDKTSCWAGVESAAFCGTMPPLAVFDWTNGNVQVK